MILKRALTRLMILRRKSNPQEIANYHSIMKELYAPELAPIKAAILPLARNKPEIVGMAKAIKRSLQPVLRAVYDDTGGIGKLYARQDEIGTPYCVTVDHQSLEDEAVTVRDRDTWEQERVKVADLQEHLLRKLASARAEQLMSNE